MKKKQISSIIEYIKLLNEKPKFSTLDQVIGYCNDNAESDDCFAVPLGIEDLIAIVTSNLFPSIFDEFGPEGNFTVTVVTISHFNFCFTAVKPMNIFVNE
jgi:hypothetical protein